MTNEKHRERAETFLMELDLVIGKDNPIPVVENLINETLKWAANEVRANLEHTDLCIARRERENLGEDWCYWKCGLLDVADRIESGKGDE